MSQVVSPTSFLGGNITPQGQTILPSGGLLPQQEVFRGRDQLSELVNALSNVGGAVAQVVERNRIDKAQAEAKKDQEQAKIRQAKSEEERIAAQQEREKYTSYEQGLAQARAKSVEDGNPGVVRDYLAAFRGSDVSEINIHANSAWAQTQQGILDDQKRALIDQREAEAKAKADVSAHNNGARQIAERTSTTLKTAFTDESSPLFQQISEMRGSVKDQRAAIFNALLEGISQDPETSHNGYFDGKTLDPSMRDYLEIQTNEIHTKIIEHQAKIDREVNETIRTEALDNASAVFRENPAGLFGYLFDDGGVYDSKDVKEPEFNAAVSRAMDTLMYPGKDNITNGEQLHDVVMRMREFESYLSTKFGDRFNADTDTRMHSLKQVVSDVSRTYIEANGPNYIKDRAANLMVPRDNSNSDAMNLAVKFWQDAGGMVPKGIDLRTFTVENMLPIDHAGHPNAYLQKVKEGIIDSLDKLETEAKKTEWYEKKRTTISSREAFLSSVYDSGIKPSVDELRTHANDLTVLGSLNSLASTDMTKQREPNVHSRIVQAQTQLALGIGLTRESMLNTLRSDDPKLFKQKVEIYRAASDLDAEIFGLGYSEAMAPNAMAGLLSDDPTAFASSMGFVLSGGGVAGANFTNTIRESGLDDAKRSTAVALAVVAEANYTRGIVDATSWSALQNLKNTALNGSFVEVSPNDRKDTRLNVGDSHRATLDSNIKRALQEAVGSGKIVDVRGMNPFISALPKIAADYMAYGMDRPAAWKAVMLDMKTSGFAMQYDSEDESLTVIRDPHNHFTDAKHASEQARQMLDSPLPMPLVGDAQRMFAPIGNPADLKGKSMWEILKYNDKSLPDLKDVDIRVYYADDVAMQRSSAKAFMIQSLADVVLGGGGLVQYRIKGSTGSFTTIKTSAEAGDGRPIRWSNSAPKVAYPRPKERGVINYDFGGALDNLMNPTRGYDFNAAWENLISAGKQ